MLTREQRDKWAEELESGKWTQCRASMRDGDAYCCLGVLATAVLGRTVTADSLTFSDSSPVAGVLDGKSRDQFASLNDYQRLSFPEIAKHVRKLPAGIAKQKAGPYAMFTEQKRKL